MLIHLVCFKYKPETDAAARHDHREQLRGLAGLQGIVELRAGEDITGSPRSYDTGLMVSFRDRGSLERYQRDPAHVPVARLGTELCDQIVAVDFEV